ncbi:MAG TPA: beta-Ig-H3/fasciclin [Cyanobacteria bacterium UBA11369]|nr:beta-Ig-H3/fasciclin [Cyanobacteria bacterium UBA11371]HBE54021.1 beta-Ig-H3/fasciclin [Cyanobacteria bacterium UBA11369]
MTKKFFVLASFLGLNLLIGACQPNTQTPTPTVPPATTPAPAVPPAASPTPGSPPATTPAPGTTP